LCEDSKTRKRNVAKMTQNKNRKGWARIVCGVLCMALVAAAAAADSGQAIEERVKKILDQLTFEEKINLTYGDFFSGGVPRLNIQQLAVADGPVGIRVRDKKSKTRTTALPSTLLLAATWDRQAASDYSSIIADEMIALKKHVLLGPGLNMMRDPRAGRSFEYFGEDPYLAAEMTIGYVRGLQGKKVGANLKHFVANEMDTKRHLTSSRVDERTLREVYLYPFERAIREADAWSIMTGNNLVNDTYVSENQHLLKTILREQVGFDGVILTDWRGAYKAKASALATLDMTTGNCRYVYRDNLADLFKSGELPMELLDRMAARILKLYARTGVLDPDSRGKGALNTAGHRKRLRGLVAGGMVLLKNKSKLLPVESADKIILTGPGAVVAESGSGSGLVNEGQGNCSILEGLSDCYGKDKIKYVKKVASLDKNAVKDAALIIYCVNTRRGGEGGDHGNLRIAYKGCMDELKHLDSISDRLLVVLQTGSAAKMTDWENLPEAVLVAWYGGQATGYSVADIISGKTNPSGRLPCTFGNAITDYPLMRLKLWPAKPTSPNPHTEAGMGPEARDLAYSKAPSFYTEYKEGNLIGHAWFEAEKIKPVYSFGYGLSYTSFELSDMKVTPQKAGWNVQCTLKNTGSRVGADVVQLYVKAPDGTVKRPYRFLRGFDKVELKPGESKNVVIPLEINDLAFYDVQSRQWKAEKGRYTVELSDSGCSAPSLSAEIDLAADQSFKQP
ncbi:beta-glucosidase, partial [Verrucomicrobiota bacterium]